MGDGMSQHSPQLQQPSAAMRPAGSRWVPVSRARPDHPQLPLTVPARDRREGGGAALAREPRLEPPLARQGLGGFREDARPPKQAEAAAAPSRQPWVLTCRLAVGRWRSTTSGDPAMSGAWRVPPVSSCYTAVLLLPTPSSLHPVLFACLPIPGCSWV